MKQSLAGLFGISALLIAAPLGAHAADLAVKAPPPAPVVYDWTGFYLDVGAGWQYDHFNWTYTNFIPTQAPFSLSNGNGSITGHVGYQQQFGWLVVGGEVGAFRSMNGNAAQVIAPGGAAINGPCSSAVATCRASIDYTSLAGGKLGVDWGDWLFYGVGGVAFSSTINTQIFLPSGALADIAAPQSTHGWYLGGGFDYMLLKTKFGDLITGVEYEHVKLDTVTQCTVPSGAVGGYATGCPGTPAASARMISASEDAVWGKLTLKFNPFN